MLYTSLLAITESQTFADVQKHKNYAGHKVITSTRNNITHYFLYIFFSPYKCNQPEIASIGEELTTQTKNKTFWSVLAPSDVILSIW